MGTAGRFQARYGVRARTQIRLVEAQQKAKHVCPNCGHKKVKRAGTGIWKCKKCGVKFAGGAYLPRTEVGQSVEKMLKGEITVPEITKEEEGEEHGGV